MRTGLFTPFLNSKTAGWSANKMEQNAGVSRCFSILNYLKLNTTKDVSMNNKT